MTRSSTAALAAFLLLASSAGAQEEGEAPDTYVLGEDGAATHNETGAQCPAQVGDLVLAQVLSYDREDSHLGIGCQYISQLGFSASISVLRANVPQLVGAGSPGERWNRSLYQILGSYPGALPANVAGLEGDPDTQLRGALFTANASGVPVRLGIWQVEDGEWIYRAQATFAGAGETEWTVAEQTRSALVAAKAAADAG